MKKGLEVDFADLTDILEGFVKKLDKMTQADLIDLAARLKPVAKNCAAIDEFVKLMVKDKLKHKDGTVPGGMFKAVLKLVPMKRFNQTEFKATEPEMYEEFVKESSDERVTFEIR